RASNTAHGVASSVPNSCRRQVRLSHRNTGVPVASPTPTWTCNSRSTASIRSSSSDSSRHTCIEATVRYAAELGYDVTVVKDATADYSDEMMHAALDINIPNYTNAIVTTSQIVASISAPTCRSRLQRDGWRSSAMSQQDGNTTPGHDRADPVLR